MNAVEIVEGNFFWGIKTEDEKDIEKKKKEEKEQKKA